MDKANLTQFETQPCTDTLLSQFSRQSFSLAQDTFMYSLPNEGDHRPWCICTYTWHLPLLGDDSCDVCVVDVHPWKQNRNRLVWQTLLCAVSLLFFCFLFLRWSCWFHFGWSIVPNFDPAWTEKLILKLKYPCIWKKITVASFLMF